MKERFILIKQGAKHIALFLFGTVFTAMVFAQDGNVANTKLTSGRLESILISVLGLASLIIGIRSFRSSKRATSGNKRKAATIAAIAGILCIILASVHIANTTGGFGTGGGKAGAIVAITLGAAGIILSGLTVNRLRHAAIQK